MGVIELEEKDIEDFHKAAMSKDVTTVKALLTSKPELLNATDQYGFSALHLIMTEEQFDIARLLIEMGANPAPKIDDGVTPLHIASYPEYVEILLGAGANVNAVNNDGATPLIVMAGELEDEVLDVMEALLESGADPYAVDNNGDSALSISRSRKDFEKVELLLKFLK